MFSEIKKIGLVLRTVSHLWPIQLVYQFRNRVFRPKPLERYQVEILEIEPFFLKALPHVKAVLEVRGDQFGFNFLNLYQAFSMSVDWNFQGHGRLWNYNLQYLDFLRQTDIAVDTKLALLSDIYDRLWSGELLLEPYTASLRIMNVIRFLSADRGEANLSLDAQLAAEINYLSKNLEYHLLGNHLLENGFALLMGGYYFGQKKWKDKGENLLFKELEEQILDDGAHFELSPMYHRIILFRVLEAISYLSPCFEIRQFLVRKARVMLTWMVNMTFEDGNMPHFNDSTEGIALSVKELMDLASGLGIEPLQEVALKTSGYRKLQSPGMDLIVDVNGIAPTYQPGHAHADTFSFVLYANGRPIITDPGISTYNIGSTREWERSTNAHNTIEINGKSSSEVWAGFRVGRRAQVEVLIDQGDRIRMTHDGYKMYNDTIVEREIVVLQDGIQLRDSILSRSFKELDIVGHLHFHPSCDIIEKSVNKFCINEKLILEINGEVDVEFEKYKCCLGYNHIVGADRLRLGINNGEITMIFRTIN